MRGVCVLDRGREPRSERARRRGDVDAVGGALAGRVGVDEERCVHDTEHRRTGDCSNTTGTGKRGTGVRDRSNEGTGRTLSSDSE